MHAIDLIEPLAREAFCDGVVQLVVVGNGYLKKFLLV